MCAPDGIISRRGFEETLRTLGFQSAGVDQLPKLWAELSEEKVSAAWFWFQTLAWRDLARRTQNQCLLNYWCFSYY